MARATNITNNSVPKRTVKKPKKTFKRRLFSAFLALGYIYISSSLLIFKGPFQSLKDYAIESIVSSHHPQLWLGLFSLNTVSNKEIQQYTNTAYGTTPVPTTPLDPTKLKDYKNITDNTIQVEDYQGKTFSAKIMLIRDPKRVKVAVTSQMGKVGETVSEMVRENHAVAGINGGSFQDVGWHGTGGNPQGTTIHNGQVIVQGGDGNVIGITRNGDLISGNYSIKKLQEFGVDEALSFDPILVKDGVGMLQSSGGRGYAPRTAIGQKEDGTIIFIVTDGRMIHGPQNLGASLRDVQDLMLQYGAITAINLDGGSSSTMVYNGKLVNEPTDVLGERKVATAFIVMPE